VAAEAGIPIRGRFDKNFAGDSDSAKLLCEAAQNDEWLQEIPRFDRTLADLYVYQALSFVSVFTKIRQALNDSSLSVPFRVAKTRTASDPFSNADNSSLPQDPTCAEAECMAALSSFRKTDHSKHEDTEPCFRCC